MLVVDGKAGIANWAPLPLRMICKVGVETSSLKETETVRKSRSVLIGDSKATEGSMPCSPPYREE